MNDPSILHRARILQSRRYPFALVAVIAVVLALGVASPAAASVTVSRAELNGSDLRLEGTATANRDISVDGVVMGRSDSGGRFRIERSGYTPPADCTVDVNDGSATPRTATLSGCTVSSPAPAPQPVAQLTPDVEQIGPGYVGSDFTTFSSTTTTITFGPDTLGPVRFEIITGQLPAGLALVDPNAGFTPAKSIHASVSGTPTTVQTSTFTIRATDANGLQAMRTYTIVINPARTLDFAPQGSPSFTVGTSTNWWMEGAGGVRPYRWAVSGGTLPPGTSLIQDNPDGPLARIGGTPSAAGTYTFTLRLADAQAASVSRTFSVTVAPQSSPSPQAAPTLLAPADGAGVTVPVTLSWSQVLDPSSLNGGYNWRISTSSTFSSLTTADSTRPSVTEASVGGLATGTYFWQVQAVSGELVSSSWSAPRSFTVTGSGTNALPAPVLDPLPFGAHYFPMEHWRFSWSAVPGAASYTIEVSDDPAFPQPVDVRSTNEPGTTSGFTFHHSLIGSWHLRVYAVDANGVAGTPSNVRPFRISYDAPIGPPPTLASPADGATVGLPATVTWNHAENPQQRGYEVQIATDPDFRNLETLVPPQTDPRVTFLDLSPGTKYWRVRHAEGDASPTTAAVTGWSAVRSFTVASGAPAMQSLWLGAPPCTNPCPGTETLTSGQEIVVSIQLTAVAPPGGAVVAISSSNPAASGRHPSSVTVPEGSAYAQFRLFAGQVSEPTPVTLTGTLGSSTASATFTVKPTTVQRLSFCCDSTGGFDAAAHLHLSGQAPDGGIVVSLSSDSPLATPPATVTVPGGSFSLPVSIPTREVSTTTTVTISATHNGTTVTAPLKLYPQQPPTSIALDRISTTGSQGASGTVRIAEGQPHEVVMRITSSHPDIARPQPEARIPYVGVVGGFSITTTPPAVSTDVTISATGAGVTVRTTLTVHPASGPTPTTSLSALGLNPTTVTAGGSSTGTVTLTAAAPSGGAAVALSSSSSAATVPAGVTVPAGATTATFPVGSSAVTSSTSATITATYGGASRTATLTVSPSSQPPPTLTAPTLVSPANGARWAPSLQRLFDWSDVAGATSYTLQVSTSSGFASVQLERTVTASQVELSFPTEGDRFWRVRANDSGGAGPWSATRSFRVKR